MLIFPPTPPWRELAAIFNDSLPSQIDKCLPNMISRIPEELRPGRAGLRLTNHYFAGALRR
jgi:hypothetical protein